MAAAAALISPPLLRRRPPPPPPAASRSAASPPVAAVSCKGSPRGNRGPLFRGRTLSTEAILAVQALKRAGSNDSEIIHVAFRRLIKSDLLAALAELRRQGRHRAALAAFVAVRRDFWDCPDRAVYADTIAELAKHRMDAEIDQLVADLMDDDADGDSGERDMARIVRALIAAGKGASARGVYSKMRRSGCGVDAVLARDVSRGLRRLGEEKAADEVERDLQGV